MPFNLVVELVGRKYKSRIGILQAPFAIGEVLVSFIAWTIRDWKTFQIVVSAPLFVLLLLYFIIPESPRWLIATGRFTEAKEILEKASRKNKVCTNICLHIPPSFKS